LRVVPDVTGQSEANAKRVLVGAGFTVRALEPGGTSEGAVVTDQKPSADARVRAGSQVLIYLGPAQ
jgi:beta-lactam-binding protein with PASTA domain